MDDLPALGLTGAVPDWHRRAACRPESRPLVDASLDILPYRHRWWTTTRVEWLTPEISGERVIAAALAECAKCPVQWECCAWAIDFNGYDVWAIRQAHREWLAEYVSNWRLQLATAHTTGESVQDMVVRLRDELAPDYAVDEQPDPLTEQEAS